MANFKNTIIIVSLCLLYLSNTLFAQKYGDKDYFLVDSLNLESLSENDLDILNQALNKYHNAKHDTSKLKSLEMISENLMHDVWIEYNLLVKQLAEKSLSEKPTLELKKIYLKSLAGAINNIGVNYEQQGNLVDAILFFHKSLKIQEYFNDYDGAATTLNNIGTIYNALDNHEKTLEYFNKSLKIREQIADKKGIAQSLNNIGSILYNEKDLSKALNCFERSYDLYREINDKEGMAYSLSNMGNIYDIMKYDRGLSYHQRSLKIRQEIGDKKGEAFGLVNVSESFLIFNRIDEAYIYAKKALELSISIGYPDNIQKSSYILSKIYKQKSDYSSALNYYEMSVQMKDSIRSEETNRASYKLQTKYEFEKQQAVKDAEHNKQMEIIAERGEKQKIITYSIALGLILVLMFSIFVFNRLQITKRQKTIIEEQKKIVEVKQQEILDSINYAKRIQAAILPSERIINEMLPQNFVYYKPKDIVAGDFYWVESTSNTILFAAADCTGHGVPGAMVSVVCNNALNRSVREFNLVDPGEILDKTREIVIQEFQKSDADVKDGMDISLCLIQNNKLKWAGANNPLWIYRNNELIEIKPNKQPVGKAELLKNFNTHEFELQKNDTLYVFTDGYSDQFGGEKGKKFKTSRLKEKLQSIQDMSMEKQKDFLHEMFENWKGSLEQVDDVCIIGVRI
ncbi:MAG: tetratricopeptide repeat protein [Flavobacteriales bacterium]